MNSSQQALILVLITLSVCIASFTPVAESHTASISGGVYLDCDQNGECDTEECGIADMPIRLYYGACGENMLQTDITDENGEFKFSELAPGDYCVFPDFELKTCGYGGNFPTTAISRNVTLESGTKADLAWFGFDKRTDDVEP